ncbi:MAG: hypothetical protein ACFFDC_07235 [Promethearchaeota archaeon]
MFYCERIGKEMFDTQECTSIDCELYTDECDERLQLISQTE